MRLPRALLGWFLLIPLAAAGPNAACAGGLAFVLNSGGASISVIDMQAEKELRRIPVLREPHHLVLTPDGKSLLVGDTVGNELLFLDPATGTVQRRMPCADPYQLGFSPDGRLLVVNGLARNQVDVYDAADYKLLKRFPAGTMPSHLAYSPDSRSVFITLQGTDSLMAIDLRRMEVLWKKPVGKTPAGVLWHNGKLLVADMGTDYLAEVDPADGRVLRHIVTGKGAHNLFASPDGKVIWVNNRVGGSAVALDSTTLTPIRRYAIPGGPDDMDFAADGTIWITRRFAEKVAVLNPETGEYRTIDVGRSPHGIWLHDRATASTRVALGPKR
jgi:DNA-binding beta-propeller fold protein YncE